LRGRFRWQILLKGPDLEELHALCLELEQEHTRLAGAVNLSVDVDPESML
jgi:primosomal protein N' (replication factor Y)